MSSYILSSISSEANQNLSLEFGYWEEVWMDYYEEDGKIERRWYTKRAS